MIKRVKILHQFLRICLAIEVLLIVICLVALIFGALSPVEWIVLLVLELASLPSTVQTMRELKQKEVKMLSEQQHDNKIGLEKDSPN